MLDLNRPRWPSVLVLLAGLALCAAGPARAMHLGGIKHMINGAEAAHPNALWHVVHDLCTRDVRLSGDPAPAPRSTCAAAMRC